MSTPNISMEILSDKCFMIFICLLMLNLLSYAVII